LPVIRAWLRLLSAAWPLPRWCSLKEFIQQLTRGELRKKFTTFEVVEVNLFNVSNIKVIDVSGF
jgi:hypothetical protein